MDPGSFQLDFSNRQLFNNFRRTQTKYIKNRLHIHTLAYYLEIGIIPKQLRLNIRVSTGDNTSVAKDKWRRLLSDMSYQLLVNLLDQYREYSSRLETRLLEEYSRLSNRLNPHTFKQVKNVLQRYAERTWELAFHTKSRKVSTDCARHGLTSHTIPYTSMYDCVLRNIYTRDIDMSPVYSHTTYKQASYRNPKCTYDTLDNGAKGSFSRIPASCPTEPIRYLSSHNMTDDVPAIYYIPTDADIIEELARLGYHNVPTDKFANFKRDLFELLHTTWVRSNSSSTQPLFDTTMNGFPATYYIPTDSEIQEELARIGYDNVPSDKFAEFKRDLFVFLHTEWNVNRQCIDDNYSLLQTPPTPCDDNRPLTPITPPTPWYADLSFTPSSQTSVKRLLIDDNRPLTPIPPPTPWYDTLSPGTDINEPTTTRNPKNRRFIQRKKLKNKKNRHKQKHNKLTNFDNHKTTILNLSSHKLSHDETRVLSRNLQFCPTPKTKNRIGLSDDLFRFSRRLRLAEYWHDKDEATSDTDTDIPPKLRVPKSFTPNPGREQALDAYIEAVESDVMRNTVDPKHSNLSKSEQTALDNLKTNPNIIIKPADKGGAVVLLDREKYEKEGYRQLSDDRFYKKLKSDPTNKNNTLIENTLNDAVSSGHISKELKKVLLNNYPEAGRFYTLPKIHKKELPETGDPPGRPIISGNNTSTENISIYVDTFLGPLAKELPSYVQDDMDFLRHIESINDKKIMGKDSLLVTMDVTALYTMIPHKEGVDACVDALDKRPNQEPPTSFLAKLITLILTLNNFVFNGEHFLQVQGTAMGTCMAPNYANLFFGKLEKSLLEAARLKPTIWLRYLDDIFFIWDHGIDELKKFIAFANSFHDSIKFTYEYSDKSVNYLDLTIRNIDNVLETDLYCKPTDAHQYLHWTSCHPPHVKKNLPFGLAYRLRRICSTDEYFAKRAEELKEFLLSRQYRSRVIDTAIERAKSIPRKDTFTRKGKLASKRIPLVTTYQPGLPNLHCIVRKHFPILTASARCKAAIPEVPIIAYRRPVNLRDHIVRARLKNMDIAENVPGFFKCGDKRCKTCIHTCNTTSIVSSATQRTYNIRQHITCKSNNVIYLITCKRCGVQYVGKTDQKLHKRFNGTRSDIEKAKEDKDGPVTRHFKSGDHSVADIHITGFDMLPGADMIALVNKETFWMKELQTALNSNRQLVYPIARFQ